MKNVEILSISDVSKLKTLDDDLRKMTYFGIVYVIDFGSFIKVGNSSQPCKAISDMIRNCKIQDKSIIQIAITAKSTNYEDIRRNFCKRYIDSKIGKTLNYKVSFNDAISYFSSVVYKDESADEDIHSKAIASVAKAICTKGLNGLDSLKEESPISVVSKSMLLGKEIDIYSSTDFPLFKAADVAEWIEYSDVTTMLRNVDDEEKLTQRFFGVGQIRNAWFLTEDGLYEVFMQAKTDKAKQFKKGVKKILHEIRTKGGYIVSTEADTEEDIIARGLIAAKAALERNEQRVRELEAQSEQQQATIGLQQKEIVKAAPKVKYYDDTLASTDCLTTTQVADDLGISAKALNKMLADAGIQYYQSKSWHLKGNYREWKLASTRTYNYIKADGSTGTNVNLVWNQRGKRLILALYNNNFDVTAAIAEINGEKFENNQFNN